MSRAEFRRWYEFHRRNPIDQYTLHLRTAALIAQTVAAVHAGDKAPEIRQFLEHLVPPEDDDEAWGVFDSLKRMAMNSAPG